MAVGDHPSNLPYTHDPTPDPKPRVTVDADKPSSLKYPRRSPPQLKSPNPLNITGMNEPVGGTTTTDERLSYLENRIEKYDAQTVSFLGSLANLSEALVKVERLLRQTARGCDRLAQGKSRGNLGLPSEEDWKAGAE